MKRVYVVTNKFGKPLAVFSRNFAGLSKYPRAHILHEFVVDQDLSKIKKGTK